MLTKGVLIRWIWTLWSRWPSSTLVPGLSCDSCHLRRDAPPLPALLGVELGDADVIVDLLALEFQLGMNATRHDRRIAVHTDLDFRRVKRLEVNARVLEASRILSLANDIAVRFDDHPIVGQESVHGLGVAP